MILQSPSPMPPMGFVPDALPFEASIRIELQEGIPVMRATDSLQSRIESLLGKQQDAKLTRREESELERYEQLDDYLSYINRLVRNQLLIERSAIAN